MFSVVKTWYVKLFSDPDAVKLFFSLLVLFLIIIFMGHMLAPAFASLVLAYLLQSVVRFLEKLKIPHTLAVIVVFVVFIGLLLFALLGLLPLLYRQASNLVNEIPQMFTNLQATLMHLPERYPDYFNATQVQHIIIDIRNQLAKTGQLILSLSLYSIPSLIQVVVYLVLVPLLVYFFLMDKNDLIAWLRKFTPHDRKLIQEVWSEVNEQIGNYVGGKIIEAIIVGLVTYICFALMSMPYAVLLGVIVGVSVVVPYIGAIVVTVPVVIIALLQWGWSSPFFYLILVYTIIITLDANILVPLLFSEVMKLHPVAIIIAILIFGGIWGFWGIFFAIPLATVVKAVLNAWPRTPMGVLPETH